MKGLVGGCLFDLLGGRLSGVLIDGGGGLTMATHWFEYGWCWGFLWLSDSGFCSLCWVWIMLTSDTGTAWVQ